MLKYIYSFTTLLLLLNAGTLTAQSIVEYSISDKGLGNHRVIIEVERPGEPDHFDLNWRRYDKTPEKRKFIIVNTKTCDPVQNIHRMEINKEKCELVFDLV